MKGASDPMSSGYLTVQQAAELLQRSAKTIRRAIAAGDLNAFRVGRSIRLREADVRAWLEANPVRLNVRPSRAPAPRPRRLPTTATQLSVARMKAST